MKIPIYEAQKQLLSYWPQAFSIRYEGKCDCCHAATLYTFQLFGDLPGGDNGKEQCGYFCVACGFSNAGSRAARRGVSEIVTEHDDYAPAKGEGPED
jgi:hypothetical protein